jgi:hypothetical protein
MNMSLYRVGLNVSVMATFTNNTNKSCQNVIAFVRLVIPGQLVCTSGSGLVLLYFESSPSLLLNGQRIFDPWIRYHIVTEGRR